MYTEEEKQFLAIGMKLRAELEEISEKIDELNFRYQQIKALLNGDVDVEVNSRPGDLKSLHDVLIGDDGAWDKRVEDTILSFVRENSGVAFRAAVDTLGYNEEEASRAFRRLRHRELIACEGHGRAALWYPTEVE